MFVPIGEYVADRAHTLGPGVKYMLNVLPNADGYDTIPGPATTDYVAVAGQVRGAYAEQLQDGTQIVAYADDTDLYMAVDTYDFGTAKSRSTPAYTLSSTGRWEFTHYGKYVFATNYTDELQYYLKGTSSLFANADADSSKAKVIATVGEHVVLGNIIGQNGNSGIGTQGAGVHWCAIGDPTDWPVVGSADAISKESDYQVLEGQGGDITNIVPTSEFTLVLRERQVWRMDYVGSPAVFSFRKIDSRRGCHIQGSAIAVGNRVYFPSRDGFMMCDGFNVVPIGYEKIDNEWDSAINLANDHLISVEHSPTWKSIAWAMPTSQTNANQLWCYNYELQRWFRVQAKAYWLLRLYPTGSSLDEAPYLTMNMDAVSPGGLSDVQIDELYGDDKEQIAYFDSADGKLKTFTDTSKYLTGNIEQWDFTYPEDSTKRIFLRHLRPWYQGDGAVRCDTLGRNSTTDPVTGRGVWTIGPMNAYGTIPSRVCGRFIRLYWVVDGEVKRLRGADAIFSVEGTR